MRLSPASSCGTATAWPGWWLMMLRKGVVGSSSSRQRSRKCSCAADRSFNVASRHLAMKVCDVTRMRSLRDTTGWWWASRLRISRAELGTTAPVNGPDAVRERQAD